MKVRKHHRMPGSHHYGRQSAETLVIRGGECWVTSVYHFGSQTWKPVLTSDKEKAVRFGQRGLADIECRRWSTILGLDLVVEAEPPRMPGPVAVEGQPNNGKENEDGHQ